MKFYLYIILFLGLSFSFQKEALSINYFPCKDQERFTWDHKNNILRCDFLEDTIISLDFNGKTYTNLNVVKSYDLLNKRKEIPFIKNLQGKFIIQNQSNPNISGEANIYYFKTKFNETLSLVRKVNFMFQDANGSIDPFNDKAMMEFYEHDFFFDKDGKKVGEVIKGKPFDWRKQITTLPEKAEDKCYRLQGATHTYPTTDYSYNCPITVIAGGMILKGKASISIEDETTQKAMEYIKNNTPQTERGGFYGLATAVANLGENGYNRPILLYNENNEAVVYVKIFKGIEFFNLDGTPLQ